MLRSSTGVAGLRHAGEMGKWGDGETGRRIVTFAPLTPTIQEENLTGRAALNSKVTQF